MICRGGLSITITGSNFDSIYGYFGNPVVPLTDWPHLGIWVGPKIAGGPEFVDQVRPVSICGKTDFCRQFLCDFFRLKYSSCDNVYCKFI